MRMEKENWWMCCRMYHGATFPSLLSVPLKESNRAFFPTQWNNRERCLFSLHPFHYSHLHTAGTSLNAKGQEQTKVKDRSQESIGIGLMDSRIHCLRCRAWWNQTQDTFGFGHYARMESTLTSGVLTMEQPAPQLGYNTILGNWIQVH